MVLLFALLFMSVREAFRGRQLPPICKLMVLVIALLFMSVLGTFDGKTPTADCGSQEDILCFQMVIHLNFCLIMMLSHIMLTIKDCHHLFSATSCGKPRVGLIFASVSVLLFLLRPN